MTQELVCTERNERDDFLENGDRKTEETSCFSKDGLTEPPWTLSLSRKVCVEIDKD